MSSAWVLVALLGPPVAAVAAGLAFRSRDAHPLAVIGLNALSPGAGLAAAGRPTVESAICVLMAQASLFVAGTMGSPGYTVPFMVVGAVWGSLYTPFNPAVVADRALDIPGRTLATLPTAGEKSAPAAPAISGSSSDADDEEEILSGYAVEVGCTECGAEVSVPVLQHMAHCGFCGSDHLVVGQEETLYLTLPERAPNEAELREALLDHYRYQHYLKLYQASVPVVQIGGTEISPTGAIVSRPEADAAAAAAEALVAKKADAYRSRLARELHLGRTRRFLSPYRHGMGTLYQAGFGRRKEDQEKVLGFSIGTVEASAAANSVLDLPAMGKLTYLKALRPAADCADGDRSLALDLDEEILKRAFGRLDRKQLDRSISTIRLGSRFIHEVNAVVWRPWWIVDVSGPRIHETLLVDSASGSVASYAPTFDPEDLLTELPEPARDPGRGLHFVPMECPTCGHEFAFDSDAVLHFCHNCHRVCRVSGRRKEEVEYSRAGTAEEGIELVPFWLFPLRIRTAGGELVTDLAHLKDGIDGCFDQIGDDVPMRQHGLYVPAIRCINSRLMGTAFNRLFDHTVRTRFRIEHERWPLDVKPRPWSVHMDEAEARTLAPLYLANAFGRRDLARVRVSQIADWLFEAEQETEGRLVYLPIPEVVTNPFRRYVGRFRGRALKNATKGV
jgi:Zn finger protein HypA/HybF involved in hydrogenase expression